MKDGRSKILKCRGLVAVHVCIAQAAQTRQPEGFMPFSLGDCFKDPVAFQLQDSVEAK
jgi:hypothetical protein